MTSPSRYYEESLYPLQDGVLNSISRSDTDFFLTGGTALSRAYYKHRYSDDLDFFVNASPNFEEQIDAAFACLKKDGFLWEEDPSGFIQNKNFVSLKVHKENSKILLKLDFVNDLVPHFGDIQSTALFHRVDPIRNILSNKLSALFRFAGKDVADIREIALHESFNWRDMINEAQQKDAGAEAPVLCDILSGIPDSEFRAVVWQEPMPTWEAFSADIRQITRYMLNCGDNSLRRDEV